MTTVADAMIAPPVVLAPATSMQEASAAMLAAGVQAAVLADEGRVCGLLTADDVARALADGYDAAATAVATIAELDPPVARPDEPLAEVHERMRREPRSTVPVVGRGGEPLGILVDPEG